jgi:hypothetical protein
MFAPPDHALDPPRRGGAPGAAPTRARPAAPRAGAKKNDSGMSARLEDSNTRPSRKSTRGSSNHLKPSAGKERTAVANSVRPSTRAARAKVARGRR